VVFFRARSAAPVSATLEAVKVQAASTTKWSRQTDNQRETVRLESGTLSIRVDHALSPRHLVVLLPDGELEDIGTTFSVSAAAAHTTQVSVRDGTVILRLHGAAALTLRAGDAWSPALPAPAAPAPASTPDVRGPKPPRSAPPAPATSAPAPAPIADASADFRSAMSALTSGDDARASTLFGAFLAQHPHDSRTEDATYLRVLALQRSGNTTGMKQAARGYLARYPHGFRAAEVEPLAELSR
jgi:TolA-binding protein